LTEFATKDDLLSMISTSIKEVEVEGKKFRLKQLTSKATMHIQIMQSDIATALCGDVIKSLDIPKPEEIEEQSEKPDFQQYFSLKQLGFSDERVNHKIALMQHYKLLYSLVDENGIRLFRDDEISKVEALPIEITEPLLIEINELNKIVDLELDDAKKN